MSWGDAKKEPFVSAVVRLVCRHLVTVSKLPVDLRMKVGECGTNISVEFSDSCFVWSSVRLRRVIREIIGEEFVGVVAGLLAAGLTFAYFNGRFGGIPFRIGFFPVFRIPEASLMWGIAIGALTSTLGAALPAWTARNVKVSEVFSKVA